MTNNQKLIHINPAGMPKSNTISQAVVFGDIIFLSGVIAMDENGKLVGENDPLKQANACLNTIELILNTASADLSDIIRLTCFATSVEAAHAYIQARLERIHHKPAATAVIVSELLVPGAVLEIEVIARKSGQ